MSNVGVSNFFSFEFLAEPACVAYPKQRILYSISHKLWNFVFGDLVFESDYFTYFAVFVNFWKCYSVEIVEFAFTQLENFFWNQILVAIKNLLLYPSLRIPGQKKHVPRNHQEACLPLC